MWITRRGEAVLLDFGFGPMVTSAFATNLTGRQQFLHDVASVGLMGWRDTGPVAIERPLPLPARETLVRIAGAAFESSDSVRAAFEDLLIAPMRSAAEDVPRRSSFLESRCSSAFRPSPSCSCNSAPSLVMLLA